MWKKRAVLVLVLSIALVLLVLDHLRPETAPMERGARLAAKLDCWSCHGVAGAAAAGGDLFAGSRRPERVAERIRATEGHPEVGEHDLADLVAWIGVVQYETDRAASRSPARSPLARAERMARRQCFSCHGDLGQGGTRNRGSLKGYVPGFFGRDYDRLTRDDDPQVVREWIVDGVPRFFQLGIGPLRPALWFLERAEVQMPAYAGLSRQEVDGLVAYLSLLRELGPLDAEALLEYRRRLGLPLSEPVAVP